MSLCVLYAVRGERRITELAMQCEYGIAYDGEIYCTVQYWYVLTGRADGWVILDFLLRAASGNEPAAWRCGWSKEIGRAHV